jgi:beta-glucosidase
VGFANGAVERPIKLLKGFTKVKLQPGESREVTVACPTSSLEYYDENTGGFEIEKMEYEAYIGTSSAREDLLEGKFKLE